LNNKGFDINLHFIIAIACITVLAPFAIDAYLPALVDIAIDLQTFDGLVQLTIAIFLLGFSLGPLIFGPISDQIGRKRLIILSLISFCLFSILCSISTNIYLLIIFRFFQAVSGSISTVCGRAALADILKGNDLAKTYSLLGLILTIAPILAPIIGGWINVFFGWRYIFYFMSLSSLVFLIIAYLKIPETLKLENRSPCIFSKLFSNYLKIILDKTSMAYILLLSSSSAVYFSFIAASPFLYINKFNLSPVMYSYVFGLGALIAALANLLNIKLTSIFGYKNILLWSCVFIIINAFLLLLGGFNYIGRWAFFLSGLLFMGLFHVSNANALTGLMDQFDKGKGTATALAFFFRFGLGMVGAITVSIFNNGTVFPYVFTVMFFSLLALISGLFVNMSENKKSTL